MRLWLLGGLGSSGTGEVMITVWDSVRKPPVPGAAGAEAESGRRLAIVDTLSGPQWESYLPAEPAGGKVTWALLDPPWHDQPPG